MVRLLPLTLIILFSTACIKTADQVQREKRFENISSQMGDTQGLLANMVSQLKDMQTQIDKLNGRIEVIEHRQSMVDPENLKQMNETMNLIKTQQEAESAQLLQIQNELKEQRGFIEKVTTSLAAVQKGESKSSKKKSAKEEMRDGLALVKNDKYKEARTQLEALINHPDLTAGDHNKVLHGLGRVEFYSGNLDKALVYFSKIYSKYPRSSLAPSSLLFIGKSLEKSGKPAEAKQAYQKVVEDYQDSKEANEAKKLL